MKVFLWIGMFIVIFLSGCSPKEVDTRMADQVIEYSYLPKITLEGDDLFYEKDVSKLVNVIKSQPEIFLQRTEGIVVCGQESYLKHSVSKTSTAFSDPNTMMIYCRITANKETITHELAHIYDYFQGYHYYSGSAEFKSLYDTYKGTFHFKNDAKNQYPEEELEKYDIYFNKEPEEFFAECSQLFFNDEKYLAEKCKPVYLYLKKIYTSLK